jgi:hypothetical protein
MSITFEMNFIYIYHYLNEFGSLTIQLLFIEHKTILFYIEKETK